MNHSADLIASLAASPLMQRELDLYRTQCACTHRVQQRVHALHAQLDRVLVFDLRFRWWGLGNNLVRWISLLRFGWATGRATFLWFSGGPGVSRRNGRADEVFFDIGAYFVAEGADWSWHAQTERPPTPTKAQEACGLTTNPDPAATQAQHTPARKRTPHARGPEDTPRPSRKPVQSQPDPGQAAPTAATRTPPAAGLQGTTSARHEGHFTRRND